MTKRLLGALAVLAVGGASIALLAPGGLGAPGPVLVRDGLSVELYRALLLGTAWDHAADALLVLLGLLLAWTGWSARRNVPAIVRVAWVGVGTALAYGLSEGLKVVVDEERPCRAVLELAGCPAVGDWSFPSNHATLAAGIAVGLAMFRPRLAAIALLLGLLVALARVVAGVHYPHDVLAGAALGAAVVAAGVLLLGKHPGLVRDHGRGGPVADAEPGQDRADVRFHRSLDNSEAAGDLAVGQAGGEEREHLMFPRRERGDAPARGHATRSPGREVVDDPGRDRR